MCFSTEASFGAAAVLGVAGVISLTRVKDRSQLIFGSLPFIFGIQQFCEGLLWLSFTEAPLAHLQKPESYVFLFFAQFLWPFYFPMALYLYEKKPARKKILFYIFCAGIATSLLLGYRLLFYDVYTQIKNHHIFYDIQSPQWIITTSSILYCIAIILPSYISGLKGTKFLAVTLTLSLLFSKIFFSEELISTWCFFAALLSVTMIYILNKNPHGDMEEAVTS